MVINSLLLDRAAFRIFFILQAAFYALKPLQALHLRDRASRYPWSMPMSFCLVNLLPRCWARSNALAGRTSGSWTTERDPSPGDTGDTACDFFTGLQVKRRQIVLNALTTFGQTLGSGIILFFLYRFLIRTIGLERLGIWSLVLATASIVTLRREPGFLDKHRQIRGEICRPRSRVEISRC